MSYEVRWKRAARDQLAAIWLDASDRAAVTAATHEIESLLRYEPATRGEGRSGADRILVILPLAVVFRVHKDRQKVTVSSVRYFPPRAGGTR